MKLEKIGIEHALIRARSGIVHLAPSTEHHTMVRRVCFEVEHLQRRVAGLDLDSGVAVTGLALLLNVERTDHTLQSLIHLVKDRVEVLERTLNRLHNSIDMAICGDGDLECEPIVESMADAMSVLRRKVNS